MGAPRRGDEGGNGRGRKNFVWFVATVAIDDDDERRIVSKVVVSCNLGKARGEGLRSDGDCGEKKSRRWAVEGRRTEGGGRRREVDEGRKGARTRHWEGDAHGGFRTPAVDLKRQVRGRLCAKRRIKTKPKADVPGTRTVCGAQTALLR